MAIGDAPKGFVAPNTRLSYLPVDVQRLRRYRWFILGSFDFGCWIASYVTMALLVKIAFPRVNADLGLSLLVGMSAGLLYLALGSLLKVHQGRSGVGSFEEALFLGPIAVITGCMIASADLLTRSFRLTSAVAAPCMALLLILWARGVYRVLRERSQIALGGATIREPIVVLGAGDAGLQLITALLRDPNSPWYPAALLDDDPFKRHRRLRGVPVSGPLSSLGEIARGVEATMAVLAMPSAPAELVQEVAAVAAEAGITLKVLPGVYELEDPARVAIQDVRDINLTDILGRRQIDTDLPSIAGYIAGKRVLVTGAGGSIGSELCRQLVKFNPRELIMLDRDESALHSVELSIYGTGLLDGDNTVLGDIRDRRFVFDLFTERRPQVVFHAAALKHLPLLEKAPGEAIKTNVWGTLAVLDAAAATGVERLVNISTDKAANPTSVLGYSKRLAEGLTSMVAGEAEGAFLSVRFGNVLGSRGSVLTAFAAQIASGGPVTVTDPGVTRYFMTIQEAVQLVIQAGAIGRPGEVLVLDMGQPVSIDQVARHLIEISGGDTEIVYTGLRDGEKMHEELFGHGEVDVRPEHELIAHAEVPTYGRDEALDLDPWANAGHIRSALATACTYLGDRTRQGV